MEAVACLLTCRHAAVKQPKLCCEAIWHSVAHICAYSLAMLAAGARTAAAGEEQKSLTDDLKGLKQDLNELLEIGKRVCKYMQTACVLTAVQQHSISTSYAQDWHAQSASLFIAFHVYNHWLVSTALGHGHSTTTSCGTPRQQG